MLEVAIRQLMRVAGRLLFSCSQAGVEKSSVESSSRGSMVINGRTVKAHHTVSDMPASIVQRHHTEKVKRPP